MAGHSYFAGCVGHLDDIAMSFREGSKVTYRLQVSEKKVFVEWMYEYNRMLWSVGD